MTDPMIATIVETAAKAWAENGPTEAHWENASDRHKDLTRTRIRTVLDAAGLLPQVITTDAERQALPPGTIVRDADGTIACRHTTGVGIVFGDERTFPWDALPLPLTVIPHTNG
jgi:hypothetical protein